MDVPAKPWRAILADVPEFFVTVFAYSFAGLLVMFLVAFPLTDLLFLRDLGSFEFWIERLPELLQVVFGTSLIVAAGFVLLIVVGQRWYAVLFPSPTEAERLRPVSLVRVLGGTALAVAGALSLTVLAGDLLQVTFKPWLEDIVGSYREGVSVLSPVLAVPFEALIGGINRAAGLDATLHPDWLHTVAFLTGYVAAPFLLSEVWPPPEIGRPSVRRLRGVLGIYVLLTLWLITESPRTFVITLLVVLIVNLAEAVYRVLRGREGGTWRLVLGHLLALLVPAAAGAAIVFGAV